MRKFFWMVKMLFTVVFFMVLSDASLASDYSLNKEVNEEKVSLNNMVVKGRKIEERLSAELGEFGHPVEIITNKELEETGFVDINRALEALVPGYFSVTKSGYGDYNYPSLHGSGRILWLLDGVRINNRLYGKGYLDSISVHNIERIEILKGGEGLFYGTGARAGVINIITKKITKKETGQFGVSYGDKEYREIYGHVTDTVKGHGLMFFGSYEAWDGYDPFTDKDYEKSLNFSERNRREFDRTNVGIKYRKEFDLWGKGVLQAQYRKNKGKFDYMRPTERKALNDRDEEIGILKLDHDINEHFSYYIKSYIHKWWTDYTRIKLDGTYVFNKALWGYQDWGVNFMTSTRWGMGHEILAGVDYQNYYGKDEVWRIRGKREEVVGLFAQYRPYVPFSPATKLAIGGRYNIAEGSESTVWDISIKTPLIAGTYFRGMTGTSFTLPTAEQLYVKEPPYAIGNPDLDPEKSFHIEAGIGWSGYIFRCEAGYFYQKMKKRITTDNTGKFVNTDGNTKINGVELQGGIGPFHGFVLNLSSTWVNAEDEDSDKQVERIPKFHAKANLSYRASQGIYGFDLISRYVGDIYERGLAPFKDVKYGNYFIADMSCFLKFGKNKRHKLTMHVNNIFDKEYATLYSRATNDAGERVLYHFKGLPRTAIIEYTYTF